MKNLLFIINLTLVFLISSCVQDEALSPQSTTLDDPTGIKELISTSYQFTGSNSVSLNDMTVAWSEFEKIPNASGYIFRFPLTLETNGFVYFLKPEAEDELEDDFFMESSDYHLIALNTDNNTYEYYIEAVIDLNRYAETLASQYSFFQQAISEGNKLILYYTPNRQHIMGYSGDHIRGDHLSHLDIGDEKLSQNARLGKPVVCTTCCQNEDCPGGSSGSYVCGQVSTVGYKAKYTDWFQSVNGGPQTYLDTDVSYVPSFSTLPAECPIDISSPSSSGGSYTTPNGPYSDGTSIDEDLDDEILAAAGIDCISFNFKTITSNNLWQEAAVKNVRFRMVVINPTTGIRRRQSFIITQALYFGFPVTRSDGQVISPGLAAEVAAQAVSLAGSYTNDYVFPTTLDHDPRIQRIFLDQMRLHLAGFGSTVTTTGSPSTVPVYAQYILIGNGNCI